jgi:hypothetical protein
MVLLLDQMSQRYGLLPSEAIIRASTFDMVVMDMAMTYEHHQHEKQKPGYVPEVDVDTLLAIKEQAG